MPKGAIKATGSQRSVPATKSPKAAGDPRSQNPQRQIGRKGK